MSLADLVGNPQAVTRLGTAVASGRLAHAVLLTGPDQVGKTTLSMALAAELLAGSPWPGALSTHPDLWLEDSDAESIRIDRVRAGREPGSLQEFLSLRPYAGDLRVAVLARADRLTEQAANSLLKTIEEPPPGTHLLLTARGEEGLPPTVVSRCQRISMGPVASAVVSDWLAERHGVASGIAVEAAELSAGRPGRALRLATDPSALATELAILDRFLAIRGGGVAAALAAAAELAPSGGAEGRERLLLDLSIWASFARDLACLAWGAAELCRWHGRREELERWAKTLSRSRPSEILDGLLQAVAGVAANAQPRLLLEALLMEIFGSDEAAAA